MNYMESIKAKLNYMTILDFQKNYNKSEFKRFFEKDSDEIIKTKKEIEDILYSIYDKNEYIIGVNCHFVDISKIISKDENGGMMTQSIETIWSDNFKKLPYNWVMGQKIGKKTMESYLKHLE